MKHTTLKTLVFMLVMMCMSVSVFAQDDTNSTINVKCEPVEISPEMQAWIDHLSGKDKPQSASAKAPRKAAASATWSYPSSTPATPFGGGTGTEVDPYLITSAQELANLAYMVNHGNSYSGKYFKMTKDIVLNEDVLDDEGCLNSGSFQSWTPIGNSSYYFKGNFDGNGHVVSGVYINSSSSYQGTFGYTEYASFKNVGITDCYISAGAYSGILIGRFDYSITVSKCYSDACTIIGSSSEAIGGIVGGGDNTSTTSHCTMSECYNNSNVTGGRLSGGVCGFGCNYALFSNCYNCGSVKISTDMVGGITGGTNSSGTFTNCFNYGSLSGSSTVNSIAGSYSSVSNCYYLSGSSANSGGAASKSAEDFADGTVLSLIDPDRAYFKQGVNGYPVLIGVGEGASNPVTVSEEVIANLTKEDNGNCAKAFNNYSGGCYSTVQSEYTASELYNKSGYINAISYLVHTKNSGTFSPTMKVYMGHSKSLFTSSSDYLTSDNLTLVYSGTPTFGNVEVGNWEDLKLDTPFYYNGSDNLVIVICTSGISGNSGVVYYNTTTTSRTLWRYSSSVSSYGLVTYNGNYEGLTQTPIVKLTMSTGTPHVTPTNISSMDYAVYLSNDVTGKKNTQVTIPVNLKNNNAITLWQADLQLPSGFSIANDAYGDPLITIAGSRTTTSYHSIATSTLTSGKTRILCSSTTNKTFSGNDGQVASITLNVAGSVADGEYSIVLSNVLMVEANEATHSVDSLISKVTIKNFTRGDVNDDGNIDGTDLVGVVNYILENPKEGNIRDAADLNSDGSIDAMDYVAEVNLILSDESAVTRAKAANDDACTGLMSVGHFTLSRGEETNVFVSIKNANKNYACGQFDLKLPEGVTITNAISNTKSHTVAFNTLADGTTRILVSSASNDAMANNANIVCLTLRADNQMAIGEYGIEMANALLVAADGSHIAPAASKTSFTVGETTGINAIMNSESANNNSIRYNLAGQRISNSVKGMIIVNGKKELAK